MERKAKIIQMPNVEHTPIDVAISRHLQNMIATYGEQKVRKTLKDLFKIDTTQKSKKAV